MGCDEAALVRLWQEKRGGAEPEDLSGNLIVQLGVATEGLNRRWYEVNTGQVPMDVQRHVKDPALGWMAASLERLGRGYRGPSLRPKFRRDFGCALKTGSFPKKTARRYAHDRPIFKRGQRLG
jgi:hypothetical protein